jgi:DtxR family transcriptional regulator, Mn-dependent transcriptional regulator
MLEVGSDRSALRAREDYVKAIYRLAEHGPVRAADVARHLDVSPVSVHKAKRLLEGDGLLVSDEATKCLSLTNRGRRLAVAMVRRHRLIETFLHQTLGVPVERLHDEAERIEHVISDDIAARFARHLGYPERDPHGHAIPYGSLAPPEPHLPSLAHVTAETTVHVISIDDQDATAVRALAKAKILPGLIAKATPHGDGAVRVRWGTNDVTLPRARAASVRISSAGQTPDASSDGAPLSPARRAARRTTR